MNWVNVELDAVADINPRMPRGLACDLDVSFVPMAAVSEEGQIDYQEERTVEQVRKGYTYFRRGDVLVAKITPCFENGKATKTDALGEEHGFGSTEFHVIRADPSELLPEYAFHLIWNPYFRKEGTANMTGSAGQKRVPADFLKRLKIPLPPLDEQRRIAMILDAADALRRRRRKALALLDTLPGAIFAEMFGDPLANERDWPARPVGEVCELLNGKAFKPSDWTEEGIPIIRIQNLNDPTKPFNKTIRRFDDRFYIRKGDCLFSWSGTPGTSFGCFDWQGPEGWLNQHIFKVTTAPDVAPAFFRHQMNIRMGELIAKAHGGVGLQHVTKGMITEMNFLVPPEEAQARFVGAIAHHDQNVFQGGQHLAHLDSLFASLQSRAFAGEL